MGRVLPFRERGFLVGSCEPAENRRAEAEFRGIGRTNVGFRGVGLESTSRVGLPEKPGDRVGSGTISRKPDRVQG